MKNVLNPKGLSMSQAQSVSNLCNQHCIEIDRILNATNVASKEFTLNGEHFIEEDVKKLPTNLKDLLILKGKYAATQGYLMEAIKQKDAYLEELRTKSFEFDPPSPKRPEFPRYVRKEYITDSQLSLEEEIDLIVCTAYAAKIGEFIHKNGKLDSLRKEVSSIKLVEWKKVSDVLSIPIKNIIHTSSEDLFKIFTELQELHRIYEQKVNYYKAKNKNLLSDLNAGITLANSLAYETAEEEYNTLLKKFDKELDEYNSKYQKAIYEFESQRERGIKHVSSLRIAVPEVLKETIGELLKKVVVE